MNVYKQTAQGENIMNTLQNAVVNQLGFDSIDDECTDVMRDIYNHGIDGGFGGFIYYHETCAFFDANKAEIISLAKDMADDFGEGLLEFIQSFRCLNNLFSVDEIGQVIWGDIDIDDGNMIKNALAWFAAEEVSRHIIDEAEAA